MILRSEQGEALIDSRQRFDIAFTSRRWPSQRSCSVWQRFPTLTLRSGSTALVSFRSLTGLLHAASLVVSLRDRKGIRPIIALCFIALAAAWSFATPKLGLALAAAVPDPTGGEIRFMSAFVLASVVGSSGYWLLVRLFWLKSLRSADCLKTIALCVPATLLGFAIGQLAPTNVVPDNWMLITLTAMWCFAFSLSLYWSETRRAASKPTQLVESVT